MTHFAHDSIVPDKQSDLSKKEQVAAERFKQKRTGSGNVQRYSFPLRFFESNP